MKWHVVLAAGLLVLAESPLLAQEVPFVKDVVRRINAERGKQKLSRLTYNRHLEVAAQEHAEWMARNRKMEHLQGAARSPEEHRGCSHHPANRVIKAGSFCWDDVFREQPTPNGAVIHASPQAEIMDARARFAMADYSRRCLSTSNSAFMIASGALNDVPRSAANTGAPQ